MAVLRCQGLGTRKIGSFWNTRIGASLRATAKAPWYGSRRRYVQQGARTAPQAVLEDAVAIPEKPASVSNESSDHENQEDMGPMPGEIDRNKFRLHWSVDMWRDFNSRDWVDRLQSIRDSNDPLSERLNTFLDMLSSAFSYSGVSNSPQAAAFWAYHVSRSGFFAAQAILGLAAARAAAGENVRENGGALSRFERIAKNGWQGPLAEAMLSYYQDFENFKEGRYSLPWDMTTLTHRQFNPFYIFRKGTNFMLEAAETMQRRERGVADDVWLRSPFLPSYYQNTFHYQTDGWLSSRSASVYESSTETLFVGRQDAMQRSTLVPMSEFMKERDPSQIRALEIAAGTGRFATFVKDNYPALDLTITDLSPFYLEEARKNLRYWKRQKYATSSLAGVDENGVAFMQSAAENLPFEDNSFDLIYCVYLFHELPSDVRKAAVGEMARVLCPGGMVILTDSVQTGDRPSLDATLGGFGDFNEPYYRDYLKTDLGALFEEFGLVPDLKVVSSTTKTLSFKKENQENNEINLSALGNYEDKVTATENLDEEKPKSGVSPPIGKDE